LRNYRVESIIRQLIKPARAAEWVFGVFDPNGDLLEYAVSGSRLDRRRALDLLCSMPLPESEADVTLKVTADNGTLADTLSGSTMLERGQSLTLVVVRPRTTDDAWKQIAQNLQPAVRRVAAAIASESLLSLERRHAATSAMDEDRGFFLLNEELQVVLESYPHGTASQEFNALVGPRDGRLPALLERTIRRLTKSWDFARIDTCVAGVGYPLPGIALRVAPMRDNGVTIGVFIAADDERHPVVDAAAAYRLSHREREVLAALLDGHSVADIAGLLNLAASTVSDHIARMIVKTNARNRIQMLGTLLGWPALRADFVSALDQDRSSEHASMPKEERNEQTAGRVSWRYSIRSKSPT
jgi:DNA-binding CsgD family transcriptional regulator